DAVLRKGGPRHVRSGIPPRDPPRAPQGGSWGRGAGRRLRAGARCARLRRPRLGQEGRTSVTPARRNHLGYGLLLLGPAAALTVLSVLHPDPRSQGTVYQSVLPVVTWWTVLHLLLLVLFALVAVALFVCLAREGGPAATLARGMLGVFVVGNSAFIGLDGIATGLLIGGAQPLPAAQQAGAEQALQALWDSPLNTVMGGWWAGLAWAVAVGASAV